MSAISEDDSEHQKHRSVGNLGLLVDFSQEGCKEKSQKDKEDGLGSAFVMFMPAVFSPFGTDRLFTVLVAYKVHNSINIF